MEKLDNIIKSKYPPKDTNNLWYNTETKELNVFDNGQWKVTSGGDNSDGVTIDLGILSPNIIDVTSKFPSDYKPSLNDTFIFTYNGLSAFIRGGSISNIGGLWNRYITMSSTMTIEIFENNEEGQILAQILID